MNNQKMSITKKILPFQGLRAIAFLFVFVCHSNVGAFEAFGAWGVSVFLVLSGFLMVYIYFPKTYIGGGFSNTNIYFL